MNNAHSALFRPYETKWHSFPNRIAMAPMTRSQSPDGVPTKEVASYYRRRVEGGTPFIITEGTNVNHPPSNFDTNIPRFYGEAALAGWKHVVDEVHAAGGFIVPQIWHVGMMRKQGTGHFPDAPSVGPSGLIRPGKQISEPMTQAEIDDVVQAFADAARDAKAVGFDGVEIHGAHGYLIDQFFWEGTNQRTDGYGGSMLNRTRFAQEILRAVRKAVGPDFLVMFRFSQWKQQDYEAKLAPTPQDLEAFLGVLVDAGADMLHASTRRFWEPEFDGSTLNLAGWCKKLTGLPSMSVGSVGLDDEFMASMRGASAGVADITRLVECLEREEFDLIAVGRALLVDPDWANKIRDGRLSEVEPFVPEALGYLS
ncbi:MAG TPA: 12-oxophytodienoate reductase [Alphaproteobacteria bacterium]|jgi:2,4-dienoyl-CoA reductase-like NADH-dependent reductase (Old Yellow Enzyme family)|nr:12-oxophytodienoate reductase [Alphaproteobacteria bacterium]HCO91832.1 12-oxophytodienoate reductase [Alphaproteobacteria bacterium]